MKKINKSVGATVLAIGALAVGASLAGATSSNHRVGSHKRKGVPAVLNFKMKNLGGQVVDLAKYRGHVLLIVNTASKCGFTPQYKGLEALHEKYSSKGLKLLGFPSNDFGQQEPGTDSEISSFCQANYGVKFDMFSKVDVKGPNQTPLYRHLTSSDTDPRFAGEVLWNFEKFLIGRDGHIAARFRSAVTPDSKEIAEAVEAELAKKH